MQLGEEKFTPADRLQSVTEEARTQLKQELKHNPGEAHCSWVAQLLFLYNAGSAA